MLIKEAIAIAGPLGYPSKMPGTSYGISAKACITGAKLNLVEGSTCHGCYALKGNYIYPSVKMAHEKRINGIADPQWVDAMVTLLKAAHAPRKVGLKLSAHHRWHDSGDLQSESHLQKICDVAAQTPELSHWLPTREIGILSRFVKAGGIVPSNLTIRVSATMVDGAATKAWPITSTVHHSEAPKGMFARRRHRTITVAIAAHVGRSMWPTSPITNTETERNQNMTTIKIAQAFPHWTAEFETGNPWAMPATGHIPLPYAVFKTSWPQLQKKLAKQFPGCVLVPLTQ